MNQEKQQGSLLKHKAFNLNKHKHQPKCGCSGNAISQSEGELVIYVKRDTFTIPFALPYAIWGAIYTNTNYAAALNAFLPAGTSVVTNWDNNMANFIFTSGLNSDTIHVYVPDDSLIAYPEILGNLNTNYMRSKLVIFNCNGTSDADTLDNVQITKLQEGGLFMQKVGGLTERDDHLIIPSSRKGNNNSVPNIIELHLNDAEIKPDTLWVHKFSNATTGGVAPANPVIFSFCVFINERINMNSMKVQMA